MVGVVVTQSHLSLRRDSDRRRDPIWELDWRKSEARGGEVATIVQKTNGKSLNLGKDGRE